MCPNAQPVRLVLAGAIEREEIYRHRHAVYAVELGQHRPTVDERLTDALDPVNEYLVALAGPTMLGFVSITPPSAGRWSLDKYLSPVELPVHQGEVVFEIRLLTVSHQDRGSRTAALLMAAALHRVRAAGGHRVIGMGRREVLGMYRHAGLRPVGRTVVSGAAHYEVMTATVEELAAAAASRPGVTKALLSAAWDVSGTPAPTPRWCAPGDPGEGATPAGAGRPGEHDDSDDGCFHGGAFFSAIGADFTDLDRRHDVVNADVLDAWFPPAPAVTAALSAHLPWLLHTSPPTDARGLVAAIARRWSVPTAAVLPGAGSSALIYLAFGRWLTPASRVLLPDPSYGEYAHVLERVIGCRVTRYPLRRSNSYDLDVEDFVSRAAGYDLAVLVNPNSPTGRLADTDRLRRATAALPPTARLWVDETYLPYARYGRTAVDGPDDTAGRRSLAASAATSSSLFVVTSLSKAYALSGARAAHLIGPPAAVAQLRRWSPPWAVGLPTQVAAVRALADHDYYELRWRQTAALRERLADGLTALGLDVVPGGGQLPARPPAPDRSHRGRPGVTSRCRQRVPAGRDLHGDGPGRTSGTGGGQGRGRSGTHPGRRADGAHRPGGREPGPTTAGADRPLSHQARTANPGAASTSIVQWTCCSNSITATATVPAAASRRATPGSASRINSTISAVCPEKNRSRVTGSVPPYSTWLIGSCSVTRSGGGSSATIPIVTIRRVTSRATACTARGSRSGRRIIRTATRAMVAYWTAKIGRDSWSVGRWSSTGSHGTAPGR